MPDGEKNFVKVKKVFFRCIFIYTSHFHPSIHPSIQVERPPFITDHIRRRKEKLAQDSVREYAEKAAEGSVAVAKTSPPPVEEKAHER